MLLPVVGRPCYFGKTGGTSNNHIVLAERAVDNEQLSVLIPAAHNTHVLVAWVEDQIPREGLIPGDFRTVIVLHGGSTPVAYDVLAACHIVEYPIDESTAIHPVGPVGSGGGATCRSDLLNGSPALIPA